jgi:hypothetical protein
MLTFGLRGHGLRVSIHTRRRLQVGRQSGLSSQESSTPAEAPARKEQRWLHGSIWFSLGGM